MLVTVDAVLTRQAEPHHFWEVRTARIVTVDGYRYLSGVGRRFCRFYWSWFCSPSAVAAPYC